MSRKLDKPFLIIVLTLAFGGFFLFTSASLGLYGREGAPFGAVFFNQAFFGLFLGLVGMYFASRIDYRFWKRYSFYIFLFSILISLLVFIPKLGFSSGGATRWISLGPLSFQPSEFLKLGFVIYFAAWVSGVQTKVKQFKFGLLPLAILLSITGAILLSEPDTGTFLVIAATGIVMFISSGGRWRDIFIAGALGLVIFAVIGFSRPYVLERVLVFLNPDTDAQDSGFQINQSFIAIGSGQIFGKGYGKSVQKFGYLPEPIGDSIFAVVAEEWGFIGSLVILFAFLLFAIRGFRIAIRAPDIFGSLLVAGVISIIFIQSFINISSMLGVFPLTGMPLIFVSHGGTALFFALVEAGIILSVSRKATL